MGDVAVINGTGGLVESIGLRTIVLRDLAGVVHIFQNGKIGTLSNMTKGWSAMVFDVGVAYKEDTDKVVEVMREVSSSLQQDESFSNKILEPIEVFGVDSFADSAVVIKARHQDAADRAMDGGPRVRAPPEEGVRRPGDRDSVPAPHVVLWRGESAVSNAFLERPSRSGGN